MGIDMKKALRQFWNHRGRAKRNNIPFELTFQEWLDIWLQSGKYHQKGTRRGQYVMSRPGDKGGYTKDNIVIKTVTENTKEAFTLNNKNFIKPRYGKDNHFYGRTHSEETKQRLREFNVGKTIPDDVKQRISNTLKGKTKGIPKPKKHCHNCDRLIDAGNYSRWHGDNCKMNKE